MLKFRWNRIHWNCCPIGEQHTGCVIVGGKDGEVVNLSTRGIQIDLRWQYRHKACPGIIIIDAGKPDGETLVIRSQFAFIHRIVVIGKRVNDHRLGYSLSEV